MTHLVRYLSILTMGVFLISGMALAQEPDVPLTWKGEGEATFFTSDGEEEIDFDLEFHVDSDGYVSGKTTTDDGGSDLEKLYYGDPDDAQYPALDSRKLILVLSVESSGSQYLVILDGRVLADKHFYGELRLARASSGDIKDALDIGNKQATAIYEDSLPSSLKKAFRKSVPMGHFEVDGNLVSD